MDVDTDSPFSADYVTARRRIREAASRLGCETQAYSIGARGPHDEDLTIDVVITPGINRDRTLVLSSGIHGVEGFFGSAVQLDVLEDWIRSKRSLPAVRCLLLHGLNPFGFAWRRRGQRDQRRSQPKPVAGGRSLYREPGGIRQARPPVEPKGGSVALGARDLEVSAGHRPLRDACPETSRRVRAV